MRKSRSRQAAEHTHTGMETGVTAQHPYSKGTVSPFSKALAYIYSYFVP